ncbi:MAG TPA: glycosyltransferase [Asticcacaulis sp.]|nr:glycosyltransferase [Asticcacaulis sp.]
MKQTFNAYPIHLNLFSENSRGLGECYNDAIDASGDDEDILVFAHDDIFILDYFWYDRLVEGFARFDLLGLAGNKRRQPRQPAWAFINDKFIWDDRTYLSGTVGHGKAYPCPLSIFGPALQECKLLDGVLLAAKRKSFTTTGIRFDPQFKFHFYDMDICRQFETRHLRMGTIALSIIHESGGAFGTPAWREVYEKYLAKWGG